MVHEVKSVLSAQTAERQQALINKRVEELQLHSFITVSLCFHLSVAWFKPS